MKTVVLCYGLMITSPVDNLAAWLRAHHVHVVMEQPVKGALYVGHSLGAGRCAMMAAATGGHVIAIDPVPPISGGTVVSASALGDNHLSVVNDPRTRAMVLRMAR
jgi:hypothetical protein